MSTPIPTATSAIPAKAGLAHTPLVIGLTGPVGSGVSTVSRVLESKGFRRISLSSPIKEEFATRHGKDAPLTFKHKDVPDWRKSLQDIGDEKRKENLSHWIELAFKSELPDDRDIVVDGIRNTGEIDALRHRYPQCYVAAIVAAKPTRWLRVMDAYDKDLKAFERDDRRDADEELPYGQQVEKCVQAADYLVWNERELRPDTVRSNNIWDKLAPDIALMRGIAGRYPTSSETYITSAYATAHSSRCLKRFVGAVIVSEDGRPLSMGYNENPISMSPCEIQYNYCYKDANMEARLEERGKTYCPSCGHAHDQLKKPWRCEHCGDNLKLALFPSRNIELCTAIHAEERAIRSLGDRPAGGSTLYVTTFPCLQCSRYIVDAGITRVVYVEAYPVKESADFLQQNNIVVEPFEGFKARAFNRIFKQRE